MDVFGGTKGKLPVRVGHKAISTLHGVKVGLSDELKTIAGRRALYHNIKGSQLPISKLWPILRDIE